MDRNNEQPDPQTPPSDPDATREVNMALDPPAIRLPNLDLFGEPVVVDIFGWYQPATNSAA